MSLVLFAHPFSSYCQKALTALYENATAFEYRHLGEMTPMQKVVLDVLRETSLRDLHGVAEARRQLHSAYGWLKVVMSGRTWAAGEHFSLADCAAAPALFFADWAEPVGPQFPQLRAYRARLLARPSFARAMDEARPYRSYFPLGAPQRD